jgi:hypothetical protein
MGRVGLEPTPDQGGLGLSVRWRCHERSEHRHQSWVEHHVIHHDPAIGEAVVRDRTTVVVFPSGRVTVSLNRATAASPSATNSSSWGVATRNRALYEVLAHVVGALNAAASRGRRASIITLRHLSDVRALCVIRCARFDDEVASHDAPPISTTRHSVSALGAAHNVAVADCLRQTCPAPMPVGGSGADRRTRWVLAH